MSGTAVPADQPEIVRRPDAEAVRVAGFRRAWDLAVASALVDALILTAADSVARNAFFPYQLPAGTPAMRLGMLLMIWLLAR